MLYTTYFARLRYLPKDVEPLAICIWPPKGLIIKNVRILNPPQDIFKKYKKDGDWDSFTAAYQEYLRQFTPECIMDDINKLAQGKNAALVCYEKEICHRFIAADYLRSGGYKVEEYGELTGRLY